MNEMLLPVFGGQIQQVLEREAHLRARTGRSLLRQLQRALRKHLAQSGYRTSVEDLAELFGQFLFTVFKLKIADIVVDLEAGKERHRSFQIDCF